MNSNQVHYNKVLSDIAVAYTPPELQWEKIFPKKAVTKESDLWPIFDKNAFEVPDDHRADGAPSRETTTGWKYDPYQCEEHALHDIITKRMRDNSDSEIDLESSITETVKQQVWNNIEVKVFGSGGILRTAANNVGSTNASWATLASASPRTDFRTAIDAVEAACGFTPNTVALGTNVARHIMATAEYREEFKYVVDIRNEGTIDLPNDLYGLNPVYVKSLSITNRKGQAKTLGRIMGDDVWIGYVNPSGPGYRTLTYGACLFTEEYTNKWWDDDRRGDKVEYGMIYQLKKVAIDCGYLLTSVLT